MPFRSCISILTLTALYAAVAGCSRTDTAAAASAATAPPTSGPAAGANGNVSYEVVTVERPESVADFHKLYRASYDLCAGIRESKKLPPPPAMKQPPADFVSQRTTYASDGKAYLVKNDYFRYNVSSKDPVPTCETSEQKTSDMELVRDGKVYHASIDEAGKRISEPPDDWAMPPKNSKSIYTESKVVKGFAVKCMPMLPNSEKLITELCIADLKPGTLTQVSGEPIVLSSRVTVVQKMAGAVVTEPVSVKVGQKVDKAMFDAAAAP